MDTFKDKFLKTLDEGIFGRKSHGGDTMTWPKDITRKGDTGALADSMEEEGGEENFNTLAPEGYADRHIDQVKGWQSKITDFLGWLNGTDASLRAELSELDDQYEGVSKNSEKSIADIAKELGALNQVLVEIPREIKIKTRESTANQQIEQPMQY